MAKDSSFDVVSEVNIQEVDNAFQQTTREISQRYDLKDSGATIELSKGDKLFTINALQADHRRAELQAHQARHRS